MRRTGVARCSYIGCAAPGVPVRRSCVCLVPRTSRALPTCPAPIPRLSHAYSTPIPALSQALYTLPIPSLYRAVQVSPWVPLTLSNQPDPVFHPAAVPHLSHPYT